MKIFLRLGIAVCLALGVAGIFIVLKNLEPKEPVQIKEENTLVPSADFMPYSFEWEVVPSARYEETMPWQYVFIIAGDGEKTVRTYLGEYLNCGLRTQEPPETGEIARQICWFGGGGDDIKVFLENGTFVVKKRWTSETGNIPDALPRGPWETVTTLGKSAAAHLESEKSTLTYTRKSTLVDPVKRNLGIQIQYEAFPICDSTKTADSFSIETGDGQVYPADCKGVQEHVYKTHAIYPARYLRNGSLEASVVVDVAKPLDSAPTSSAPPTQTAPVPSQSVEPKEPPPGSMIYADFWKTASKGTTLEKYVWGASGDDDYYDGGPDTDTLRYRGTRAEHEIVRSPLSPAGANSFLLIRRIRDNSMDIVLNIEIFVFADQTVKAEDLFK